MFGIALLITIGLSIFAYFVVRARSISIAGNSPSLLHSRPSYHGLFATLLTAIAGLSAAVILGLAWNFYIDHAMYDAIPSEVKDQTPLMQERLVVDAKSVAHGNIVDGNVDTVVKMARAELASLYSSLAAIRAWSLPLLTTAIALIGAFYAYRSVSLKTRARNRSERIVRTILMFSAAIAIITTLGILFSLIGETVNFFRDVSIWKFLLGTHWSPLSGVFEGKVDENTVGIIPLFAGTLMITVIAMLVAVPIGLLSAIYLSEFASHAVRAVSKPMLEILAGIPTVVYGVFAAITVAPFIRYTGESLGLAVSAQSALAAGIVMGIMIIPFISSLSDDVINAVPQALRDGSFGIGATKAETIIRVVLPAALPGIVSAIILAISRAVGETMIVVMAAGQGANLTANPLESVTTVTVQIVALINGDTDAGTAAGPAFSLGFTLFFVTMLMNLLALRIVNKYRQKYD
jgi:phosphate transport system permease protein